MNKVGKLEDGAAGMLEGSEKVATLPSVHYSRF